MTERTFFTGLLWAWFFLAAVTFVALYRISAPYGRHDRGGWGPKMPFVVGWMVMELPAAMGLAFWYAVGDRHTQTLPLLFLALWQVHYVHRGLVYPLVRRRRARSIPLTVVALAVVFNTGNAYLNGRYLYTLGPLYPEAWLRNPRFVIGVALFVAGFGINLQADRILLRLRRPGETGYRIPRGGLFRWVSCPNYFGEILEWSGWALATWSLPGLAFAVWTAANLVPRAHAHHRWYRRQFGDYPAERRRLIPYIY